MDEFYDLFLTGERAQSRIKFRRFVRIFAAIGAAVMLVPLLIVLLGGEYPALNSAFSVVGLVFEFASVVLVYVQTLCERALTEVQNAANEAELRGGERALYRRLYHAWKKAAARRDVRRILAPLCKALAYAGLAVSVVISSYLAVPSFVPVISCFSAAALLIASFVLQTASDLRLRTALYEEGEEEIDTIKREKLGYDEVKIAKEGENARLFRRSRARSALLEGGDGAPRFSRGDPKIRLAGIFIRVSAGTYDDPYFFDHRGRRRKL